jgi:hypothetical protein
MTSPTDIRIPADVDQPDRLIAGLTARQLALLGATGVLLYAAWWATRTVLPVAVFLVAAVPIGVSAVILALGHRDGLPLDRLVLAALRQRVTPRHRVAAPEGMRPVPAWLTVHASGRGGSAATGISPAPLRLPAHAVHTSTTVGPDTGVVDLGDDGLAVLAAASTVNFALRTPGEQEALVAGFGRYLHALSAPVQILIRTERLDLTGHIHQLREYAAALPHPALEAAACEHAAYLAALAGENDLLRRQVLLVLREPLRSAAPTPTGLSPTPALGRLLAAARHRRRDHRTDGQPDQASRRAAEARLIRRLTDAVDLLTAAGIVLTPLDAGQATAVLASACNPDTLLPTATGLAGADEVITTNADTSDTTTRWDDNRDDGGAHPGGVEDSGYDGDIDGSDWHRHPDLPHIGWQEPGAWLATQQDTDYDQTDHDETDYDAGYSDTVEDSMLEELDDGTSTTHHPGPQSPWQHQQQPQPHPQWRATGRHGR